MSYIEILKEEFERVRSKGTLWYDKAARWFLVGNILLYVTCCVVASGLVGPVGYIEFLYHCCQWKVSHG